MRRAAVSATLVVSANVKVTAGVNRWASPLP
jgi:hypothetical protein